MTKTNLSQKKPIWKRILGFFFFLHVTGANILSILFSTTLYFLFKIIMLFLKEDKRVMLYSLIQKNILRANSIIQSLHMPNIIGKENVVNKKPPFLIIANHQSSSDVWLANFFPHSFHFLMKKELFKIPIFGWALKEAGNIPLDRSSPRKAGESAIKVVNILKNKQNSVWLYPEGTRNKNPDVFLPYKAGFLSIAAKAGVPIAPVIFYNTAIQIPAHIKWYARPKKLTLSILPIIDVDHELHPCNTESKYSNSEKLEKIRELMQNNYNKIKANDT